MKQRILASFFAVSLLDACAAPIAATPNNAERGILSTKMVNLSPAVNAYFADLSGAPTDDDEAILYNATLHNPRLLASEFKPYTLKVQYQNQYAVLLLCTKDNNRVIMEDAGCSARLDRQVTNAAPCEFTLRINQGCQVEGADPQ